jgi:predicted site-specific integrase-resolvase
MDKFTLLFYNIPMKLSQWAKKLGISYRTAWRMYQKGQIPNAVKLPTGSIIVLEDNCANKSIASEENTVAIYLNPQEGSTFIRWR